MPIIDRCKFCLREWDSTPNPNIAQAKADPTKKNLQKARKEGRECGPCRGHIKSQFPEWDDKKTALEKQIAQDETFADAYKDSLRKWENKTYVEGGRSRGAGGGAGAGVTLLNTAQYRTTELVGYLWPVPIYQQNINKRLPKHLTTIKHCGRLVKGVVGSEDPEVRQDPEVEVQEVVEKEIIPRRHAITMRELEKYGFTPVCPGCEAKRRGGIAKSGHN